MEWEIGVYKEWKKEEDDNKGGLCLVFSEYISDFRVCGGGDIILPPTLRDGVIVNHLQGRQGDKKEDLKKMGGVTWWLIQGITS